MRRCLALIRSRCRASGRHWVFSTDDRPAGAERYRSRRGVVSPLRKPSFGSCGDSPANCRSERSIRVRNCSSCEQGGTAAVFTCGSRASTSVRYVYVAAMMSHGRWPSSSCSRCLCCRFDCRCKPLRVSPAISAMLGSPTDMAGLDIRRAIGMIFAPSPRWRNWQTHYFEVVAGQPVQVQVLSWASSYGSRPAFSAIPA